MILGALSLSARRAWIEIINNNYNDLTRPSLSARRAWIEIPPVETSSVNVSVALRKESVDRNWYCLGTRVSETLSLSARRAWIEMSGY